MEPDLDDTVAGSARPAEAPAAAKKKRTLADLDDDTLFSRLRGGKVGALPPGDDEDTIAPRRRPSAPPPDTDDTIIKAPRPIAAPPIADVADTLLKTPKVRSGLALPDLADTLVKNPRPASPSVRADVEDTVVTTAAEITTPRVADLDDTLAKVSIAPPPALVEPPAPEPRPLPLVESLADLLPAPDDPAEETIPVGPPPPRLLLPDGTELPIDVTVYVGRKPSVPRIHVGPPPRLVTLPSPSHELSATHLELRVVGEALVASDMRSTNGTTVRIPGSTPRTLIRGESAVITPGTRIDLGDGAVVDILAPVPVEPAAQPEPA